MQTLTANAAAGKRFIGPTKRHSRRQKNVVEYVNKIRFRSLNLLQHRVKKNIFRILYLMLFDRCIKYDIGRESGRGQHYSSYYFLTHVYADVNYKCSVKRGEGSLHLLHRVGEGNGTRSTHYPYPLWNQRKTGNKEPRAKYRPREDGEVDVRDVTTIEGRSDAAGG